MLFVSTAWAQEAAAAAGAPDARSQIILWLLILGIFYFLLIRPQLKQVKQHRALISGLRRGDKVIIAGMVGTVSKVEENEYIRIKLAPEVEIQALRSAVTSVVTKTEPANGDTPEGDADASAVNDRADKKSRKLRG